MTPGCPLVVAVAIQLLGKRAPCWRRSCTMSTCPFVDAPSAAAFTSAPCWRRSCTTAVWPLSGAFRNALSFSACTSAPCSMSSCTVFALPFQAAHRKAMSLSACTFAPCWRRRCTPATSPQLAAKRKHQSPQGLIVSSVHVGTVQDEKRHNIHVTLLRGQPQGAVVIGMHVCVA